MKKSIVALAPIAVALTSASPSSAAITINIDQVGNDVIMSGSGSMSLTGLRKSATTYDSNSGASGAGGFARIGSDGYNQWLGLSTGGFGTSRNNNATTTSGNTFGVLGGVGGVYLPLDYVSGSALNGMSTFAGRSLQGMGLNSGTYTFNSSADSITVNIGSYVPGVTDNPPPAIPAPASRKITYNLTGQADYSLNGVTFTNSTFQITGVGDISTRREVLTDLFSVSLSSLTGTFGGTNLTFTGGVPAFRYITDAGFGTLQTGGVNGGGTGAPVQFIGTLGYDGISNFGPQSVTYLRSLSAAPTTAGVLAVSTARNLVFSANLAAVPEPATWAMMIGGFGLVGGVMRRSKRYVARTA